MSRASLTWEDTTFTVPQLIHQLPRLLTHSSKGTQWWVGWVLWVNQSIICSVMHYVKLRLALQLKKNYNEVRILDWNWL